MKSKLNDYITDDVIFSITIAGNELKTKIGKDALKEFIDGPMNTTNSIMFFVGLLDNLTSDGNKVSVEYINDHIEEILAKLTAEVSKYAFKQHMKEVAKKLNLEILVEV